MFIHMVTMKNERSRIVHEIYEEILQEKIEFDTNQCKEAAGGAKKKRIYGLESEGKSYCGSKKFIPSGSNASSSVFQPTPITNMSEFVMQLIPALTDHFL